jgi:hypothetical protein
VVVPGHLCIRLVAFRKEIGMKDVGEKKDRQGHIVPDSKKGLKVHCHVTLQQRQLCLIVHRFAVVYVVDILEKR